MRSGPAVKWIYTLEAESRTVIQRERARQRTQRNPCTWYSAHVFALELDASWRLFLPRALEDEEMLRRL